MKYRGKVYFDFEFLKQHFNMPQDALLKCFDVSNLDETVTIEFYTNEKDSSVGEVSDSTTMRRSKLVAK